MALRECAGEQPAEKGFCEPLREAPAGHRIFHAVLVQALRGADRLDPMRMPPQLERTAHLLVAELPSADVPVVPRPPPYADGTKSNGENDGAAVLEAAGAALNPNKAARGNQIQQGLGPLVPAKHVGRATGHDRSIREDSGSGRRVGSTCIDDRCRRRGMEPTRLPHQAPKRATALFEPSKKAAANVPRGAGHRKGSVHAGSYLSFGRITASMTWITPLLATMSVFATCAPSTVTPPRVAIVIVSPLTAFADCILTTSAAITLPATT